MPKGKNQQSDVGLLHSFQYHNHHSHQCPVLQQVVKKQQQKTHGHNAITCELQDSEELL